MTTLGNRSRGLTRLLSLVAASSLAAPMAAQVDTIYHLARRITPGFNRVEIDAARNGTFQDYLDDQLDYTLLPHAEGIVGTYFRVVNWSPSQIVVAFGNHDHPLPQAMMQRARLWRLVYSGQAFYERMTWFWANHFNIDFNKRAGSALQPDFDLQVCRAHTFGSFRDMLFASSGYASGGPVGMLQYLDNTNNKCTGPNSIPQENYSREVMELHALGTDPQVYTEGNVRDLARMLSGWSLIIGSPAQPDFYRWEFRPNEHCAPIPPATSYNFFSTTSIPYDSSTASEGRTALANIVSYVDPVEGHVCAKFIAKKMVHAFLSDVPPVPGSLKETIIDTAISDGAAAFGPTGDIEAMLRAILTESNIQGILEETTMNPGPGLYKYMSPWLFMSSVLRASAASITHSPVAPATSSGVDSLLEILEVGLGQASYEFGPPIGYPESIEVWCQNQPARWEFAYRLFEKVGTGANATYGTIEGVTVDVPRHFNLLGGYQQASAGQQASDIMAGGALSADDVTVIQRFADLEAAGGALPEDIMWQILALAALAPSFNLY